MPFFKPPKAWQKLAPDTIESWMVSDDPREQRLAAEAFDRLGADAAPACLLAVMLREERMIQRRRKATAVFILVVFASLLIADLVLHRPALSAFGVIVTNTAFLMSLAIRQTATTLQRRIVETALAKRDVRYIGILFKSLTTVTCLKLNADVREQLPQVMAQVNVQNCHLVPPEHWQNIVETLATIAKQKKIAYIPQEMALAQAHIAICANARHEPALPALQAIAALTATRTPQARALQEQAAQCLATWHELPTMPTFPRPTTAPEPVRLSHG